MFDVEEFIDKEFYREALNRGIPPDPRVLGDAKKPFDVDGVKRYIQDEIDKVARRYQYDRYTQRWELEKITDFHKDRLREIVRQYVSIIARQNLITGGITGPRIITESSARRAKADLKASRQAGCDIYPC
ncbi:hypothetical protein [Shewanella algae]|uniref:hypothetical protein n=1 Tax=Shewanella algae TaxID=38313 RepID=UPI001AAD367F|nr:hypothetical protein [Shewanella algae]MBO2671651.1 hypothetical protein [Shewanella algae]